MTVRGIVGAVVLVMLCGCGGDTSNESKTNDKTDGRAPSSTPAVNATASTPAFAGRFSGTVRGAAVRMTLREESGALTGDFVEGMASYRVSGTIDGNRAKGTLAHQMMGFELPFTAKLDGDAMALEIRGNNTVKVALRRGDGATAQQPSGTPSAAQRDPRLVGTWKREIIANRRNAAPGYNVTTHVTSQLFANGRFRYGGGQSVITLTDPGRMPSTGMTDKSGVIEGEWKSEGSVLFSKRDGTTTWIPLGRYAFSGNAMVVYTLDGSKQLWERR